MKRWGIAVTGFYMLVVAVLLLPLFLWLASKNPSVNALLDIYRTGFSWIWPGILVGGQVLLLFLSVDGSWRRAKPRQHIAVTAALTSFFAAVLTGCILISIAAVIYGDRPPEPKSPADFLWMTFGVWIGFWIFWGGIFYRHYHGSSSIVSAATAWLLKGSVLELLIAVPAHVIARQRGDCSAPIFTSFGIVTGIAIMLLSFGPGVLALYKKRLDAYSKNHGDAGQAK